ncbi:MAG: hypothetical protein C0594_09710 [Marinilabiliales bacterium]|nr:MAG: hypothetical protein C0594_09710 [Marinilabiliales bacterium]
MFNQKDKFMRKFTIFTLFMAFTVMAFAQGVSKRMPTTLLEPRVDRSPAGEQISPLVTRYNKMNTRSIEAFGDVFYEESFAGGPGAADLPTGWTTEDYEGNQAVWTWTNVGAQGPTASGYEHVLASTTASDGWMILDSDNYGSASYDAVLTSPAYDFSAISSPQLVFEELYQRWGNESANPFGGNPTFVEISTDGNNWTQIEIHADFGVKDATDNPGIMKINLTPYVANEPVVYIRFRMQGLWDYWWQIDDLAIVEAPSNDLVVNVPYVRFLYSSFGDNSDFFYNTQVPKDHAYRYFLGAGVENLGATDQTNVGINVKIDDGMQVVFDDNHDSVGTWGASLKDTLIDTTAFMPGYYKADYRAVITAYADETEQVPEDNSDTIFFSVSDTTFANDIEQTGSIAPWSYTDGAAGDLIGTCYWIEWDDTVSSISAYVSEYTTPGSTIIKGEVWKYDSNLGDNILQIDSEEHIIQPEDLGTWVTLPLTDETGLEQNITGGATYYAMINCTWSDPDTLLLGSDGANVNSHSYTMESALRTGSTWYYISYIPMVRLNLHRSVIEADPLQAGILDMGNVTCTGANDGYATVNAIGGDGNYTYEWSNAETDATISGLSAGTYTVTVTDGLDSTEVATVDIMESAALLEVSVTSTDATTIGGLEGTVDATVTGGTTPYTFVWSNGAITEDLTLVGAGVYELTVTDAYGCEATASATVSEPDCSAMTLTFDGSTNVTCNGGTDGAALITAAGGTEPYTYLWNNGETVEDAVELPAGYAVVIATDDIGCAVEDSVEITEPTEIAINGVITDVVTAADGEIDITVTGGTSPYTFNWSNGETTEDLTSLDPATYTVSVTDAAGCEASESFILVDPGCDLVASISTSTNVSCNSLTDGSATADQTGGTAPYTYNWSNGETTAIIGSLGAGTYTVTITDDTGTCSDIVSVDITEPTALDASATGSDLTCNGNTDGTVDLTVTGGITPYTFAWSNSETTEDLSGVAAGTYDVTVTDANTCEVIVTGTEVTEPSEIQANSTITDATDCDATNGEAQMYIWGGTSPYTFAWSNGETTEDLASVAAGDYFLTITDANGCEFETDTIAIGGCDNAISEIDYASIINVFPNPTTGVLNIANADNSVITIIDIIGNVVEEIETASTMETVNISGYPEGSYFIRIANKDYMVTKKVVLVK